ncbi:hypothetical protein Clacol_004650 [Clathrus columnatus]|uniref:Snurportin-1 n=1 Tax=Clathrus columnatus TaxID=1419009 RepID=A0AAV5A727_9AGAM|nr:hypothetical protein Clacol_004650 [Clathrus columnatus]
MNKEQTRSEVEFYHLHMNRRQAFKTPPVAESTLSQQARREKKRSLQIESSRNIDAFSNLSLDIDEDNDEDGPTILREGVGHLAPLLPHTEASSSNASQNETWKDPSKKPRKPNARFANKIMYAELLEMRVEDELLNGDSMDDRDGDGLPLDLDTNWVALCPIPKGKRCLAVSNQSSNIPGRVSNAVLKSRLMGRTILSFPSPLPPLTILDCILDENWKTNGILHVLDVVLWKGQNIGECEANFRFWWRNTRLDELVLLDPVMPNRSKLDPAATDSNKPHIFAYPVKFIPVPYHVDLSYPSLLSTTIPLSRSKQHISIKLPPALPSMGGIDMDVDYQHLPQSSTAEVESDGLLLYVSQASYECGTSPLSSWVPLVSYTPGKPSPLSTFEKYVSVI